MKSTFKLSGYSFALTALTVVTLLFSGCKTDILSDDGESTLTANNIRLRIFPYVNGTFYNSDSVYFLGGANVTIDEIIVVHDNYFFVDQGDTLPKGDPAVWKLSTFDPNVYLYQLSPGSYSGMYRYLVGIDSVSNLLPPSNQPQGSPLNNDLYRGSGKGYNFVTIRGKIQDPSNPGSAPSIPYNWVLSGPSFNMQYGMGMSFNLVTGKPVTFDVIFSLEKLFTGLAPLGTPEIKSDPNLPNDMANAQILQSNFQEAYKIQL
jgi:hypothetical protein